MVVLLLLMFIAHVCIPTISLQLYIRQHNSDACSQCKTIKYAHICVHCTLCIHIFNHMKCTQLNWTELNSITMIRLDLSVFVFLYTLNILHFVYANTGFLLWLRIDKTFANICSGMVFSCLTWLVDCLNVCICAMYTCAKFMRYTQSQNSRRLLN